MDRHTITGKDVRCCCTLLLHSAAPALISNSNQAAQPLIDLSLASSRSVLFRNSRECKHERQLSRIYPPGLSSQMAPARGNQNLPLILPAPVYSRGNIELFLFCEQAAEEKVLDEEPTVPGEPPGVYGCDYKGLTRIAILHAGARLDLLKGDSAVRPPCSPCTSVLSHSVSCGKKFVRQDDAHCCSTSAAWAFAGHLQDMPRPRYASASGKTISETLHGVHGLCHHEFRMIGTELFPLITQPFPYRTLCLRFLLHLSLPHAKAAVPGLGIHKTFQKKAATDCHCGQVAEHRTSIRASASRRTELQGFPVWHAQAAVEKLEAAKAAEDGMSYMEPPRLWQPIRHCLGFVHLNATGDHAAADRVSQPPGRSTLTLLRASCLSSPRLGAIEIEEERDQKTHSAVRASGKKRATASRFVCNACNLLETSGPGELLSSRRMSALSRSSSIEMRASGSS